MADWDIHAPGLTCLYDLQDPEGHLVTPGVLDILSDLAGESGAAEVIDPGELLHRTRVGKRMTDEGDIWFLSAGAFSPRSSAQYEEKIRDLRPELPRLATMGKDLLTWLEERVIARFRREDGREPDFLFLDARTGLTEVGDLLMSRLPNHRVVLVFGLNEQNLKGLEHVFGQLVAKTGVANAASRIVLVASPIPPGEEELKRRRMQAATAMLEGVLTEAARRASAQGQPMVHPKLPPFHTVPFHPLVALTEEPIAERFPESDIAVAFAAIANRLRGSAVEVEKVQSSIGLSVRETAPSKPSEPARLVEPEAEHPMARRLAWDVVRPGTKPKEILRTEVGAEAPAILEGLAN
ncbi:MAG TPA: hypothetical protein VK459_11990, partial [Polyangiaceae bacterium]|nr:hypothetical protein [Polyangiaceae bacterium]